MNLIQALANAIRLPELRNKILFTGGMLIVFRLFANVAIPGASHAALSQLFNSQPLLGLLDLFSGGGLSTFSLVAMGMNPFINATIIMQLMTVISERIKEISKEGEEGRRRIQRWSRYLTVLLGAGQAYGFTVLFQNTSPAILPALDWFQRGEIVLVLTAGTVMLMWF
ncbi:MAG TPA: preprotein translocase subunit SecY, partial [Candidatus Dormibacteraeota bacterium]|nr:preprotein translocase subunit SecY [Candidatus Dormibacteraeota bacterium]